MSDSKEKKTPPDMTDRMFLHKSTTKAAVAAKSFIDTYRPFLLSGTRKSKMEPILASLDNGQVLPTPALELIRNAVFQHMNDAIIQEGINKIMQSEEGEGHTTSKNYLATIYNLKDEVQTYVDSKGDTQDLVKGFDDGEHAKDWVDRRLFDGFQDWYGQVVHTKITIKGEPMQEVIQRSDSIARILKRKKKPAMHERGKSTKSLGFGVKAHQDRASFSKG